MAQARARIKFSVLVAACVALGCLMPLGASALPNMSLRERVQLPLPLIEGAFGHFAPGGLVLIQLRPDVKRLEVDGEVVPRRENTVVFGYDRDSGGISKLHFHMQGGDTIESWVRLRPRSYDVQHIDGVPPELVTPPPEAWDRIREESRRKNAARLARLDAWPGGFIWPLQGRVTGHYGSQRYYNGEPRRPHYGIDIAAPAGTAVRAAAAGRVSLAAPDMYFEGGLIFIAHGMGVTSAYMHLQSVDVKVGDWVKENQQIGTVGSTGLSTGPHLDWRVFWRKARIDPQMLVGEE